MERKRVSDRFGQRWRKRLQARVLRALNGRSANDLELCSLALESLVAIEREARKYPRQGAT